MMEPSKKLEENRSYFSRITIEWLKWPETLKNRGKIAKRGKKMILNLGWANKYIMNMMEQ